MEIAEQYKIVNKDGRNQSEYINDCHKYKRSELTS